jgi:crossover junction endodeoxyribonuclease RuvC
MKNILCLDLATKTGFAVGGLGNVMSGVWDLKPTRFESPAMRFVNLRMNLNTIATEVAFEHVFFEEVRRHMGTDAAHIYGGLMAVLTEWCEMNGVPYSAFGVGEIKRYWTGKGNATKAQMIQAAKDRGFQPQDDNEADALAIFHLAFHKFGGD